MNILEARRRTLGKGVYKKTVEGNPAIAQGSLARMYPGITMQGWTEQNGTPTPETPVPIVSAGTQNQDAGKYQYEVKLTGANLFNPEKLTGGEIVEYNGVQCYKYIDNPTNFTYIDDFAENTQYCINVRALRLEENENRLITIKINYTDGSIQKRIFSANELVSLVSSVDKTIESISGEDNYSLVCYLDLSITTLGIGTEPLPFQPYKEQTVTLTADRPLTKWDKLEKRAGQWGWVYKSAEIVLDGSEDEAWLNYSNYNGFLCSGVLNAIYARAAGVCSQGVVDQSGSIGTPNTIWLGGNTATIYWINNNYYDSGLEDEGLQNLKDHLSQIPVVIWYETESETFVPLSESEQEQMNALHTFRPTTVLSNNEGCEMSLTYKTKKSLEVTT